MNILNKILKLYFKIPRRLRFFVYYAIAFYMFLNQKDSNISINIEGGFKGILIGIVYLPQAIIKSIEEGTIVENVIIFLIGWFALLAIFLYYSLPITIIYFVERNVSIRIKRDNTKYTTEENILYYRELLDNISPAVISIVDNYKIEPKKDALAGILKLVLSGHVKMDNNTLEVIDKETESLSISQKELYNMIRDGKLDDIETEAWKTECYREATNEGYVYLIQDLNQKHAGEHFIKGIIKFMVIFISSIALIMILNALDVIILTMFLILFLIVFSGFYIPYLIGYTVYYLLRKSDFRYTEKGEKTKNRIEGLKRFINDYSSLDEKDKKEVVLWDDYLIYAVLFEQNKSIIKDMLKLKGLDTEISFDEFSFVKDV